MLIFTVYGLHRRTVYRETFHRVLITGRSDTKVLVVFLVMILVLTKKSRSWSSKRVLLTSLSFSDDAFFIELDTNYSTASSGVTSDVCNMLSTVYFGFVDDVMFAYNKPRI